MKALLWDVNISEEEFRRIVRDKSHPEHKWGLRRLFSLFPAEELFTYITPSDFLMIWPEIKDDVEEDFWGRGRYEQWSWLYRVLMEKESQP